MGGFSHQVVVAARLAVESVGRLRYHATAGVALKLGILLLAVGDPLEFFLFLLLSDIVTAASAAIVFERQYCWNTHARFVVSLLVVRRKGKGGRLLSARRYVKLLCLWRRNDNE